MENQQKIPFHKNKWFWVIIALVFFYWIGSSNVAKQRALNVDSSKKTVEPVKTEEIKPVVVTASVLTREYEANEVAADQKFMGKTVEVTGVVDSIAKDILNTPYVTLEGNRQYGTRVQCMFNKGDEAKLATLSKGQKIKLVGTVKSGKLFNVLVDDCRLGV